MVKNSTFGTNAFSNAHIPITGGKLTGNTIEITCPKLNIEGGLIKEGNKGMATALKFSECEMPTEPTKCGLESPTIITNAVKISISNATEIEIAPEGATEIATVHLINRAGKICAKKGKEVISGTLRVTLGNAGEEIKEHTLTFNANSKITINGNAATIAGSGAEVMLASLEPWAIMTP